MLQRRIVTKYITPPEVGPIADKFRDAAKEVNALASRVKNTGNNLDNGWIGKSRNKFFSDFGSTPADIERYATCLDQMADDIAAIKVMVEEEEWYEA